MSGDWPALEGIDWPRAYARTEDYPDEFGEVRVVDPVEAQQARRDLIPSERTSTFDLPLDDGARLDTPENRRQRTIDDMTADLEAAVARGEKAKRWARSIGLSADLIGHISEGIDELNEALEYIRTFETK